MMTLSDIAHVLNCSRAAASQLRAGKYSGAALAQRYAALVRIANEGATVAPPSLSACADAICRACDRDECGGCRCLDIHWSPEE